MNVILSLTNRAMQPLLTSQQSRRKKGGGLDFISWTTIRYRSVVVLVITILLLGAVTLAFIFPEPAKAAWNAVSKRIASRAAKIGSSSTLSQAHFTYIDGSVKVKKANSNSWITANYDTALEKGDVVQTTAEGMAKIVFTDGTNYTVKQDSLIVVEENSTNKDQQTNVAVQVSTGTVDLSTATFTQGSRSEVRVAGASASLAPESSASVRTDPGKDEHEILLKRGSASVTRGGEIVKLADFEKVNFKTDKKPLERAKAVLPPFLVSPSNMSPIFIGGDGGNVQFAWTSVARGKSYRLRLSRNPYFSDVILDKTLDNTNISVTGLAQGAYYWEVQAVDENGKQSVESEKNRFTIVPKGSSKVTLALDLKEFAQHGHVVEVIGNTEAGARVMVNGQEVPMVGSDGSFHYFTPPLPQGESVITVTAQNSRGGVNTKQHTVVIQ
jgi:hypothetical protein